MQNPSSNNISNKIFTSHMDAAKTRNGLRKKACENNHVCVRDLPDCLALQYAPYKNESYK